MHPNEELIRRTYAAMGRGDGRALSSVLTPDTRWTIAGRGPLSGVYTGPNEIFGLWKKIADQTGGGLRLTLQDVLANDERAVALVTAEGSRNGRHMTERQVAIFDVADGRFSSATFIYEDPQVYDDFWAE